MDWQDLRHFVAVAQTGSLSAAARGLRVDHATVSRRIASLEDSLGLKLVDRLPRQARLTGDGQAIAALASGIEGIARQIERRARSAVAAPVATVRINASPAVAARLIAPGVADFHRNNPGVTIHLAGASGAASLDRGEADVAVRLFRPAEPDLVASRIGIMRFGLYATPELAALPPADWRFIGYDEALDHVSQQAWLKGVLMGRPIVFRASDLFAQQEAARAGLGAVVLPRFMGDVDAALVPLPTPKPAPTRDIWLAAYPDLRRSPAIRAVMAFVRTVVGCACPVREP
jgi:DNA-binding transcriptional LysR family regulator